MACRLASGGIGVVDPLHDAPGPGGPPGDRLCALGARVKRLDAQPVIGLADELLVELGALERGLDQPPPRRLVGGREFGGEGKGGVVFTHLHSVEKGLTPFAM